MDFLEFLFSQLMKDAISFSFIEELKLKNNAVSSHQFFEQAYSLPEYRKRIISCKIRDPRSDDLFKSKSRDMMLKSAKAIKDIREFVGLIHFDADMEESLVG